MRCFHFSRVWVFGCFFALVFAALVGCRTTSRTLDDVAIPRLHLEAVGGFGSERTESIRLLRSGTSMGIVREPLVNEFEVENVELVQVEMGMAIMLQLNELAARRLYRASVASRGARVVLMVSGVPVGARRLDGPITDGNFLTFTELSDDELSDLVMDLRESLEKIQKRKRR